MATSLYEQVGGETAMDAVVDLFYKKVLADVRIKHFFDGIDYETRQANMQKAFLTFAFSGPKTYEGRTLKAAHAGLVKQSLNDSHFDTVLEHLETTLQELWVDQAADIANSVRLEVFSVLVYIAH